MEIKKTSFLVIFVISLLVFSSSAPVIYFLVNLVGGGEMNFAPLFVFPLVFFVWFIFVGLLNYSFFDKVKIALLSSFFVNLLTLDIVSFKHILDLYDSYLIAFFETMEEASSAFFLLLAGSIIGMLIGHVIQKNINKEI